jgi:parallel beta-helix repeat protein
MLSKHQGTEFLLVFLVIGIVFLSVLSTANSGNDGRGIIYVDDDNTSGPWDGTSTHPYQYIRDGVDAVNPGDTVFVLEGIYHENVDIDKTISLRGEEKLVTIIDGMETNDVIAIYSPQVNISNFTIRNSGNIANAAGIKIGTNQNRILNNNIIDNNLGIRIQEAENNLIYENNFVLNTQNAHADDGENAWDNGIAGNYWDDFEENPGYPDTYEINENNVDRYPLNESNGEWYINQPPYIPSNPEPADETQNISIYSTCSWSGGDPDPSDTVTYDIYFADDLPFSDPVKRNQSTTTYNPGILFHENVYYWKIVAWDTQGLKSMNDSWSFLTDENHPPNKPSNPVPSSGTSQIALNAMLKWDGEDPDHDNMLYDIYFGTNTTPWKVTGNITSDQYEPEEMDIETMYYWRVVIWDEYGLKTKGDLWNFTTRPPHNNKPFADAGGPYTGYVDTPVSFDGSKSNDTDGNITKWSWDFGDGKNGTGQTVSHTYSNIGVYNVTMTVTDDRNATASNITTAIISQPNRPPSTPTIQGPSSGTKLFAYSFEFRSTDEDNDMLEYTVLWGDGTSDTSDALTSDTIYDHDHSWSSAGKFIIEVTVSDGQTSSLNEITILIDATDVGTIGYMTDDDGDGAYDRFFDNYFNSERDVKKQNDGTFLIDIDSDGKWDHKFDPVFGDVSNLDEENQNRDEGGIPWLDVGIGLIVVFCVIGLYLFKRNRDFHKYQNESEEMQQAQFETKEDEQPFYPR